MAILRDAAGGPEVLLTHRPPTMAFGPGLHVFPGGAVDDGDADARILERLVPSPLGDPAGTHGPAFVVAAIREAWEESGILLASGAGAAGFPSPVDADGAGFGELVLARDVRLRGDWLVPLSRWVTPPVVPRRYDARFFVAWLPEGSEPTFHGGEVVAHEWIAPLAALDAMADGRIELWMPTSATLQQLGWRPLAGGCARAGAAWTGASARRARRRGIGRARDRARGGWRRWRPGRRRVGRGWSGTGPASSSIPATRRTRQPTRCSPWSPPAARGSSRCS